MPVPVASVIFSTYNSEAWLRKTLLGFAVQDRADFEVIVADDGSGDATRETVDALRGRVPFEVSHVWQPDEGFRKSRILNKAIVDSRGDYLIFTDGDCVPRRDFVSTHLRLRERGRFLSGGYFKLPLDISTAIGDEDIAVQRCFDIEWLRGQGLPRKPRDVKLTAEGAFADWLDALVPVNATWNGHNASGWKDDLLAANGFDERMGYGGQDREFGERLENAGVRGKRIRHRAICLHLDHARGYRTQASIDANLAIRARTRAERITRTDHGIAQLVAQGAAGLIRSAA
ncbi:glycosyl transferase family 2 [Pseudoxanthomonas kalamensis DSM 18571]|uniref:glycosyltransferase family 2 protein n=1 Tax=Pseudoxanthomonas kalamensis TaxID=289483 RepID=UPI0013917952|nr:glycosyltransferase family 2 protein [Pseudoxanthomonas kalamensis]KAF1712098.1 glycosyl transferase family 2 [Pseudoxanthomonas kalamensis DSM 18571]